MKKAVLLPIVVVAYVVAVVLAHAQQTGKVARIGLLDNSTASGIAVLLDAFREEMRKLGWIDAHFSREARVDTWTIGIRNRRHLISALKTKAFFSYSPHPRNRFPLGRDSFTSLL